MLGCGDILFYAIYIISYDDDVYMIIASHLSYYTYYIYIY